MKRNYWRSIISMILSVMLVFSTTMTIFAETTIINNPDGTVTERNKDEIKEGTGGDYSVTINITENTTGTLNDGSEFESKVEKTTTTDYDDYRVDHTEWTEEGYSKTTQTEGASDVTVNVPLEEGASDSAKTEVEEPNPKTEGDEKTGDDDTEYNYTVTTVTPGEVTVTTEDITVSESASSDTNMNYVNTDTTAGEGTDLFITGEYTVDANGNKVPVYYGVPDPTPDHLPEDQIPEGTEDYGYTLLGTGNSSQFYPCIMYTTPGEKDQEPSYIAPDGTPYYTHRGEITSNYFRAEGVYIDGEKVSNDNIYGIWGNVAQYVLIDGETGELITTYCADHTNYSQDGYGYNMVNVEDANYYTEEQAEMIRTVAKNGYWGVADDPSTPDAEFGSLAAMRQMMADATDETGNKVFTEDEIALLSDGIAMTATQFSIWNFSNAMQGVEFMNCHWINKDENDIGKGWSYDHLKNIPKGKEESVALIFKLYDHLINMEPTKTTGTSKDTIYTKDSFVDDVQLTVVDKVAAADHENNRDDNKDNDAYYTNLTFALVVAPAERAEGEPQDDLVVTLYDSEGNVKAKGRIAGTLGEDEILLTPDENNNYSFTNVIMTEGNQTFSLNLTGIQYLEEGIYLYSSEIRPETEGKDTDGDGIKGSADTNGSPSQTMVGVAGGAHGLNVSMEISFNVDVDDEITVIEHFWSDEGYEDNPPPPSENTPPPPTYDNPPPSDNTPPPPAPRNTPPEDGEEIPEDPVPLNEDPDEEEDYEEGDEITILDEEIPLAEVPETGDASDIMMLVVIFAVVGLIAVNLPAKKRYNV